MLTRQPIRTASLQHLVPVRNLDHLDWLVKESEMLTGTSGREFVVAGADRPAFLVQIDHAGYAIARIDDGAPGRVRSPFWPRRPSWRAIRWAMPCRAACSSQRPCSDPSICSRSERRPCAVLRAGPIPSEPFT